jgi:hypothetical protein
MLGIPSKFWKDVLTERDGESYELQRLFLFIGMFLFIIAFFWGAGLETWHVLNTPEHSFDLQSFFQATGTLLVTAAIFLGGGSASIYFKSKTENCQPDKPQGATP